MRINILRKQTLLSISVYIILESISPVSLFAQSQEWLLYNKENTMFPGSSIRDIAIDNEDNKWIAYSLGLIKLTGNGWISYNNENSGLPDNNIYCLVFDEDNNLWIGSFSGLTMYDGEEWTVYTEYKTFLSKPNHIEDIVVDYEGNVWIGVGQDCYGDGGGLIRFDGTDWVSFDSENSSLPDYVIVTSLEIDIDSTIWIGTHVGLVNYDGESWTIYNQDNSDIPVNFIHSVSIHKNGDKWIGFFEDGVAKFDGNNWIVYNTSNSMLPNNCVYRVDFDSDDNIWIGTYNGLARYNNEDWEVYRTDNSELPDNFIKALIIDDKNTIWIGTYEAGLGILNNGNWSVLNNHSFNYLPDNQVCDIETDSHGNVWVATLRGFATFNGTSWTRYETENSLLPSNYVYDIEIDIQDNKWIGTEHGLVRIKDGNWTVYNTTNSGLPVYDAVHHLDSDSKGNLWLATSQPIILSSILEGSGLAKFNGEYWIVFTTDNSGIPSNYVSCLKVDNGGDVWFGTGLHDYYTDGLVQFNGSEWNLFNTENSDIPSNKVSSIAIDTFNAKWIGTMPYRESYDEQEIGGGLAVLDETEWTVYNQDNSPLPSNDISALLVDSENNIWIGTAPYTDEPNEPKIGGGLAYFNRHSWQVFTTENSLLPSNRISSLTMDNNQNNWIGTWPEWLGDREFSLGGIAVYNTGGVVLDLDYREQLRKNTSLLLSNYPNPFNSTTTLQYYLPESTHVKLIIYNLSGQEIEILIDGYQLQGTHQLTLNAEGLTSGIYLYQLQTGEYSETKKLILQK